MSSHAFRGAQGAGIAFNKVVMAIVNFPRLNIKTWINQSHAFTMNPREFTTTAASTVEVK